MKFPYLKLPSRNPKLKWISRPYIPIRLIGSNGIWEGYGLIDSGADRSLFNTQIAEKIGLNLNEVATEDFSGIEGGGIEAKLHKLRLQVIGMDNDIEIVAGFVESSGVAVILGQDGFFDAFRIKFERDHGTFEITPVKR
ncbi:hypothetical protein A3I48_00015 [Candidatus Daviesbacteria bacterium RIFCSPLOWO2_02_FULL_36_7]|uniref:Peptidase A2 domain-containing protein n=1 Tax=Candidatus Daviesbacteria bacterium RIFCSPLOWO2_02_FULL_36_7 TaxID=1797792 RepID=A0A1F5MHB2_9BACT|nr:MAG: hypothetical protein A3I48_00015 [Candidatus Daviesbacteria bacterium RIFCSPLOWO2_02_FULL_36_7]